MALSMLRALFCEKLFAKWMASFLTFHCSWHLSTEQEWQYHQTRNNFGVLITVKDAHFSFLWARTNSLQLEYVWNLYGFSCKGRANNNSKIWNPIQMPSSWERYLPFHEQIMAIRLEQTTSKLFTAILNSMLTHLHMFKVSQLLTDLVVQVTCFQSLIVSNWKTSLSILQLIIQSIRKGLICTIEWAIRREFWWALLSGIHESLNLVTWRRQCSCPPFHTRRQFALPLSWLETSCPLRWICGPQTSPITTKTSKSETSHKPTSDKKTRCALTFVPSTKLNSTVGASARLWMSNPILSFGFTFINRVDSTCRNSSRAARDLASKASTSIDAILAHDRILTEGLTIELDVYVRNVLEQMSWNILCKFDGHSVQSIDEDGKPILVQRRLFIGSRWSITNGR